MRRPSVRRLTHAVELHERRDDLSGGDAGHISDNVAQGADRPLRIIWATELFARGIVGRPGGGDACAT